MDVSPIQVLLIFIVAFIAGIDQFSFLESLYQPIVTGFLVGHFSGLMMQGGYMGLFFKQMILANLGFMIFNLIPIPPLDGSRILYAIAPDAVREVLSKLESSLGIFLVMMLVYIFGNSLSMFTSSIMVSILKFFYFIVGIK